MTKLVVALGFCVAFAAGLTVGLQQGHRMAVSSATTPPPSTRQARPPRGGPGILSQQLNLTPQQQEQMRQIWSDMAGSARHDREERRAQLRSEREDAIAGLIRPEDYGKLDTTLKNYREQFAALDADERAKFDAAVEKTKAILTPEQRTKYEDLLSRHQFPGPRGGPGGPEHDHGGPGDRGGRGPNSDWARDHDLNRDTTRRSDGAGATSRSSNP